MSEQDDQIFLKRFSLVLAGLVVFAVIIIFAAIGLDGKAPDSENPGRAVATAERIQPVFDVHTSPPDGAEAATASAAPASASETPAAEATAGGGAEGETAMASAEASDAGDIDGQAIYEGACQVCHMAGAAGAPQLVADQWTDRLDKGMDTLVSHAINGFNAMPAKGGRMDLSDAEVRASVEYMVSQVR